MRRSVAILSLAYRETVSPKLTCYHISEFSCPLEWRDLQG